MSQVRIARGRQAGAVALIAALAVAGCTGSTGAPSQLASALAAASLPPIQAPAPCCSSGARRSLPSATSTPAARHNAREHS